MYLKGHSTYGLSFSIPQRGNGITSKGSDLDVLELHSDSDWSGDKQTRKSVSSGVLSFNGHVLNTSSRTQKSISLSSCEAEFNAAVSGLVDMIFVSNAAEFLLGCPVKRIAYLDSSSAKALLMRQGVGRTRHLRGKLLWVQDLSKKQCVQVSSISTLRNVADVGTKALSQGPRKGFCAFSTCSALWTAQTAFEKLELMSFMSRSHESRSSSKSDDFSIVLCSLSSVMSCCRLCGLQWFLTN